GRFMPRLALAGGAHRMDAPWLTLAATGAHRAGADEAQPARARLAPAGLAPHPGGCRPAGSVHPGATARLRKTPQAGAYWPLEGTRLRPGSGHPGWVCRAVTGDTGTVRGDASVGCDHFLRGQACPAAGPALRRAASQGGSPGCRGLGGPAARTGRIRRAP